MSLTRVVAITGCDSGLGWALAARSAREGFLTVAGMYNGTETKAAEALQKLRVHPCPLDVTKPDSVTKFKDYVFGLLKENSKYRLYAVVNNAGVMTIGDYEWQTPEMIQQTIEVNLLGSMRIASAFLPELRRNVVYDVKPRIINIASHCGVHSLPGFAAYSASKAGMLSWTRALRFEYRDCELKAVAFLPGGFVGSSKIMSNQVSHGNAMLDHLDEEQKSFYGGRINTLNNYLQSVSQDVSYDALKDEKIIETFMSALCKDKPHELYKVENLRYKFHFTLLKFPLPEFLRHRILKRLLSFPDA